LPALWPDPRVRCLAKSERLHDALFGGCDVT
jgi:hypothetical protein